MLLSDFVIGEDFMTATSRWRCTDIGTRTITAIRWPDPDHEADEASHTELWLQGPPYVLPEKVFDEKEMEGAYRSVAEAIVDRRGPSAHPGFESGDVIRMFSNNGEDNSLKYSQKPHHKQFRLGLLRHDRVRNGSVLHPYAWRENGNDSLICVLDIFSREWFEVPLFEFLALPISTEADLVTASANANSRS